KNNGPHLMQGPVAVYDEGQYVGDCQLPDVQPGQERLVSYAIDLGVEVRPEQDAAGVEEVAAMSLEKGAVKAESRSVRRTAYRLNNRSKTDRVLLVEHPITSHTLDREGE